MKSRKKLILLLSSVLVLALLAAAAIVIGTGERKESRPGEKRFTLTVEDLDGNVTEYPITTDADTVGRALLDLGMLEGEEGPYGLYIKAVNGIRADYELDGHYWAFYVNGEYAVTGIDQTPVEPDAVYGRKVE